jgi:hypothetical protein
MRLGLPVSGPGRITRLPTGYCSASFPDIAKLPAQSHVANPQGSCSGAQFASRETNRQANDIRAYRAERSHVPVRTNYLHLRASHEPSDHTSVEGDHLFWRSAGQARRPNSIVNAGLFERLSASNKKPRRSVSARLLRVEPTLRKRSELTLSACDASRRPQDRYQGSSCPMSPVRAPQRTPRQPGIASP